MGFHYSEPTTKKGKRRGKRERGGRREGVRAIRLKALDVFWSSLIPREKKRRKGKGKKERQGKTWDDVPA